MAKTPAPDPRFDPRFQRGYDGPEPTLPSTPAVRPLVTRPPVVRPPVAEPPVAEPSVTESPRVQPLDEPVRARAYRDGAVVSHEIDDVWVPPRRNPFALALLIGGLAMIAVGGWLVWTLVTASSYPNGYDRGEQAFALIQQQLSPALLICGVLGVVGWLVLGALTASARKRD